MGCGSSKASTAVMPEEAMAPAPAKISVAKLKPERNVNSGKSIESTDSGFDDDVPAPKSVEKPLSTSLPTSPLKARGGCAFEISLETPPTPKRMPPRLAALTQKPRRELTMLELDRQQRQANARRREAIESVRKSAADETRKVDTVASSLTREKTTLGAQQDSKENKALENRQKHLENLRKKLKAQEEKAKRVREAKKAAMTAQSADGASVSVRA